MAVCCVRETYMREILDHRVNECNEQLRVDVLDQPGPGGACHHYRIAGYDEAANPGREDPCDNAGGVHLLFQNGPIGEVGTNGITHEALLAVLIDRLRGFQAGAYACQENEQALVKLIEAQQWLQGRTRARVARGVEGSHAV